MPLLLLALALIPCASAQVVFHVVVQNAANPAIQGVVIPDSLINISATTPPSAAPVPLPRTLDVSIHDEPALVVGAQGDSVTVLVPADLPIGATKLSISENGGSGVANVSVIATDFELFTNSSGVGQAVAQNYVPGGGPVNDLTHPAHPGDTVTLYGTGLGSAQQSQVAVLLGGHPANVSFAGHAPALPGTDVINFQVPSDPTIPNGCFVAVQVVVDGSRRNLASLSKAAPGVAACTPPIDLTFAQMTMLDAGESVPYVSFIIDGLVWTPPDTHGLVRNESFNVESIVTNEPILATLFPPLVADDVFYSCTPSNGAAIALIDASAGVDLGPELTLTGPGTTGYILTSPGVPIYSLSLPTGPPVSSPTHLPPPYFVPGVWQISSPGAQPNPYSQPQYAALPFSAQIITPPVIELTNYSSLKIADLASGLVVAWNPLGYGPADVVTVNVAGISCRAPATAGQLSVPPVKLTIAEIITLILSAPDLQISVAPRPDQIARTDIPLEGGGSIPGTFRYSFTEALPIQPALLALQ